MMTGTDNADVECSENKVEGEDCWRTVNCLRGRLLAERMASRNAREEAEHLGIRLLEVQKLLEQEGKSRNRAEKKLKFLMKRLQTSTSEEAQKLRKEMAKSLDLASSWSVSESTCAAEGSSTSSLMGSNENSKASSAVEDSYSSGRMESSSADDHEEGINGRDDRCHVDNSMALVPVEMSSENERVDPGILDATVKQVLESLRRAKEQLQSSRRVSMGMIKVG